MTFSLTLHTEPEKGWYRKAPVQPPEPSPIRYFMVKGELIAVPSDAEIDAWDAMEMRDPGTC